jgi:hypothetical protein
MAALRTKISNSGYTKFNDTKNDYDGLGRDTKGNNTTFIFSWFAI